jgi:hypothetical protein
MTTFAQLDRARDRHRAVATRAILAVAVLVPSCVLFLQAWNNERGELDSLAGQQHGVAYVRALQPLIGAVVAAESTAVAGATVNLQPVDRAALAVAVVDQRYGADLRTQVLWADADDRIQQLHSRSQQSPTDSFAAYSGVAGLLLQLADKVGATAGLSHNAHPELAALQDGAAHQLPAVVVAAGAYADLLVLGGADPRASGVAVGPDAVAGAPTGTIAEQLADQRAAIEQDASDLVDDIQNASDASPNAAISQSTLAKLDQFRIEVDALVGDGTTAGTSTGNAASARNAASAGNVASAARAARTAADDAATTQAAANTLAASILQSVDSLLTARVNHERLIRSFTIAVGVLAIVIALTPLVLAAVRRRRVDDEPITDAVADEPVPTPSRLSPPRDFDPPVYDGGALPRRRPAVAAAPTSAPDAARELMPAGVMHHRRSAAGASNTRPIGTDIAIPSDDWGPSGVAR